MKRVCLGLVVLATAVVLRPGVATANCYPSNAEGTFPSLDAFDRQFGVPCLTSPFTNPLVPYVPTDIFTGKVFQTGQGRPFVTNGVREAQTSGFWTGTSVEVPRNGPPTTTIRDSNGVVQIFTR